MFIVFAAMRKTCLMCTDNIFRKKKYWLDIGRIREIQKVNENTLFGSDI